MGTAATNNSASDPERVEQDTLMQKLKTVIAFKAFSEEGPTRDGGWRLDFVGTRQATPYLNSSYGRISDNTESKMFDDGVV